MTFVATVLLSPLHATARDEFQREGMIIPNIVAP